MSRDEPKGASPSYAWAQLQLAVERAQRAGDRGSRARAEQKVRGWQQVLDGMASGQLLVGSRTPVADTPAWVTLEVMHGGFASGRYLAEQPLDDEELSLLAGPAASVAGSTPRECLNLWFLSDSGQQLLSDAVESERYRVDLPEHSALLVVSWLLKHGHFEIALDLVSELRPLMHRLRFSPRFVDSPKPQGATVHLASVGQVREPLRASATNSQMTSMLNTVRMWNPLYDRLVALWCTTVDGDLPSITDAPQESITGGWPGTVWPDDWAQQRQAWLSDFAAAKDIVAFAGRHAHRKSNFGRLARALEESGATGTLAPSDAGWVRRALANTISKHGAPDSEPRVALRTAQKVVANRPTYAELAHVLAARLDRLPSEGGLPFLDPLVTDVTAEELGSDGESAAIPAHLIAKVRRALEAPLEELVRHRVVTSGEVLARVLPQITSQALALDVDDPRLAEVFGQTYAAFRRRRSLLLLNLEHQVRIEELPWIRAIATFRTGKEDAARAARRSLAESTMLVLTSFPQAILPNPLVREMGALSTAAGIGVPLVEEVAADIFMGTFTTKWRRSAVLASELVEGTLYARYYDIPRAETWLVEAEPVRRQRWRRRLFAKQTAEDFARLCDTRAQQLEAASSGGYVARNGTILEQAQILTTHNVVQLIDVLELGGRISELASTMAATCLSWISEQHGQPQHDWRAQLQMIKNSAYALRQAVLYLNYSDPETQRDIVASWRAGLEGQPRTTVLLPVADGLTHVIRGGRFDSTGHADGHSTGQRLLGWSVGRHWLLGPAPDRAER